ncbi:Glycosyltransferase [Thalictrum thalictroides]|uniref:Glycosyltransferase n=1 Tax=Thalictrum thalictroides TaxID=46969 RepID=A0A7J6VCW7_THATH|nr:Glycosyltransferase [Thalictrum thalictroides]
MGSEAKKLHVFFFPLMAHGHTIPMIDIARLFAARGTKCTIITTPLNVIDFKDTIDRAKESGLDIGVEIFPFPCVESGLPEGCENVNSLPSLDFTLPFVKALQGFQEPLERLIEKQRPDCIVSDMLLFWTADPAKKFGVPRLVFHGTSTFSLCVIGNILRYAPEANITSDSEVVVLNNFPGEIKFKRSQVAKRSYENRSDFIELRKKMYETELMSFGIIINSFYELEPAYAEYYRKDLGRSKTWYIGPVSLSNRNIIDKANRGKKATIDEHDCLHWLDLKEPNSVLYVSFGSLSCFNAAQLLEIAMGLEASNVSFIWVVRMDRLKAENQILPEGFEERMEGKGLIIKDWAPQVLILDHPAVGGFMTHCGWNSTLEGISAGLPLITWPVFAEQFYNEKLVTQVLKTGITAGNEVWSEWVEPDKVSVTKDRVQEVVNRLMGNGEEAEDMRRRAKELGERANKAAEEGGSSYNDLTSLLEKLRVHSESD